MPIFFSAVEESANRVATGRARPAPDWIVAKRREYRVKAALLSLIPLAGLLLGIGGATAGVFGSGRRWKEAAGIALIVLGGLDALMGLRKRRRKYSKAASILGTAIARFETAQYADIGALDAAGREAAAALE